jgi:transposase
MRDTHLYSTILGIAAPWNVTEVDLQPDQHQVEVRVSWSSPERPPCPCCGRPSPRYDSRERRWRHLDTCQYRTILVASVPRVECPDHGVVQIDVPWSEKGSGFTAMFERLVIDWLREAPISAVAELLGLTWDQVDGVMTRAVCRGLARRALEPARIVGVDETSFQKRHEYVTVVSDLETSAVLYVADGKDSAALDGFFNRLTDDQIAEIDMLAMDMSAAYLKSAREHVPDAERRIAIDRFHVSGLIHSALDSVRRSEHKRLQEAGEDCLKGTRYLWLQNPESMGETRLARAERAFRDRTLRTARAWAIKEESRTLWRDRPHELVLRAWRRWLGWVQRSRIPEMVKAGRTIRKHLVLILNAVRSGVTNAGAEAINAKIQRVKRMACGFRNRARFRNAIYFHLGQLDLYPALSTHTES